MQVVSTSGKGGYIPEQESADQSGASGVGNARTPLITLKAVENLTEAEVTFPSKPCPSTAAIGEHPFRFHTFRWVSCIVRATHLSKRMTLLLSPSYTTMPRRRASRSVGYFSFTRKPLARGDLDAASVTSLIHSLSISFDSYNVLTVSSSGGRILSVCLAP